MSLLRCTLCSVVISDVTVVVYFLFSGHLRCHCYGVLFVMWSFAMSLLWCTFCSVVICDVTVVVYICDVTIVVYYLRCTFCDVTDVVHLLRHH